jgi:hypothetical protein
MNHARRPLKFETLGEVMPDVDRLLEGHTTVGNWTLGQICNHLSESVMYTIDGFPDKAPWVIRRTIGPILTRRMLRTNRMPEGVRTPKRYQPRPGVDARAEAEALRASLRLLASNPGPFAEHPFAGPLSRADWDRFHCVHFAHHLSFAVPS